MNPSFAFADLCPAPPDWSVPPSLDEAAAARVAALAGLEEWRARPVDERERVFAAALLLDAGAGARRELWEMGAPIAWREHVVALVRHHELPFGALDRSDLDRLVFRVSLVARNDDLALLASACALASGGGGALLGEVGLFVEYTREMLCLDRPREFPSDHARFAYFRTPGRDPNYPAFDDTRVAVTVMSGLPGAGKDHWIAAHRPGVAVVSLDDLREELGVRPSADQGPVVAAAYARAREHLRAGTPFVWNATNVTRALRSRCIALMASYSARVEVVSVEAPPDVIRRRNRARPHPVPDSAVARMAERWEVPDLTEAHSVALVSSL